MRTPVRARHACAVSHGQGAAPETASRSRGPPAKAGRSRRRRNIVATPGKTVIASRLRRPATPSGVKRSTRRTALPTSSGASSAPFRPNECESGSAASTTSSGVSAITGPAHERCAKSTAACERSAPFGRPGRAPSGGAGCERWPPGAPRSSRRAIAVALVCVALARIEKDDGHGRAQDGEHGEHDTDDTERAVERALDGRRQRRIEHDERVEDQHLERAQHDEDDDGRAHWPLRRLSNSTPPPTRAMPSHSRRPGRSPRNAAAKTATSTTLSLSIGATFEASPALSARK